MSWFCVLAAVNCNEKREKSRDVGREHDASRPRICDVEAVLVPGGRTVFRVLTESGSLALALAEEIEGQPVSNPGGGLLAVK